MFGVGLRLIYIGKAYRTDIEKHSVTATVGALALAPWALLQYTETILFVVTLPKESGQVQLLYLLVVFVGYDNAVYDANVNTPSRHSHGSEEVFTRRHDTKHNDTQDNDTRHGEHES